MKVRLCPEQVAGICFPSLVIGTPGRCPSITNTTHIKGPFSVSQALCTRILWKWKSWKLVCLQDGTYGLLCLDDSLQKVFLLSWYSVASEGLSPLSASGEGGEWKPLHLLDISFHLPNVSLLFLLVSVARTSHSRTLLPG